MKWLNRVWNLLIKRKPAEEVKKRIVVIEENIPLIRAVELDLTAFTNTSGQVLNRRKLREQIEKLCRFDTDGVSVVIEDEILFHGGITTYKVQVMKRLFTSNVYVTKRLIQAIRSEIREQPLIKQEWLPHLFRLCFQRNESVTVYTLLALQMYPPNPTLIKIIENMLEENSNYRVKEQLRIMKEKHDVPVESENRKSVLLTNSDNSTRIAFGFKETRDEEYDRPVFMTAKSTDELKKNISPERPQRFGTLYSSNFPHLIQGFLRGIVTRFNRSG